MTDPEEWPTTATGPASSASSRAAAWAACSAIPIRMAGGGSSVWPARSIRITRPGRWAATGANQAPKTRQVALLERPWLEEVRAEADPRRVVALWAAHGRQIYERVGPIMRVVRDAAVTDPDMAVQWATNDAQRAVAFRMLATMLEERGGLRRPVDEAVDVLCALHGPEVYGVLADRGWTPEQWERFTVESITSALLE